MPPRVNVWQPESVAVPSGVPSCLEDGSQHRPHVRNKGRAVLPVEYAALAGRLAGFNFILAGRGARHSEGGENGGNENILGKHF